MYSYIFCACVLSRFSHFQLFVTPWTVAHQAPLAMGFSRQVYWSELSCSLTGIFSTQGSNTHLLPLLCGQEDPLLLACLGSWKPICVFYLPL